MNHNINTGTMKLATLLSFAPAAANAGVAIAFAPSRSSTSMVELERYPSVNIDIGSVSVISASASPRTSTALHSTDSDGGTNTDVVSPSSSSLYQPLPTKKPWTLGILTSGFPPQQLLVPVVKFVTFQVWRLMMNELVTHDEDGRFVRESFQAGNDPSPLVLDDVGSPPRYKLYLGNPCPWCHRVKAAMALLNLEDCIPVTMLIDNAEKASKGGVSGLCMIYTVHTYRLTVRLNRCSLPYIMVFSGYSPTQPQRTSNME